MIAKLCSTLPVLKNKYYSVENRCSVQCPESFRVSTEEDTKVERVELGPLPSARRGEPISSGSSCVPAFLVSASYCPSGVVTSVPAGGLNSNMDGEIGARV